MFCVPCHAHGCLLRFRASLCLHNVSDVMSARLQHTGTRRNRYYNIRTRCSRLLRRSLDLAQEYLEEGPNLDRAAAAAARRSRYLGPQHPQDPQQLQAYDHYDHHHDHHSSSTQAWGDQGDGALQDHGWGAQSGGWGEDGSGVGEGEGVGVGVQVDQDGVLRLKSDRPPLLQQAKQKAHQEQQQLLHSTRLWWPQQQLRQGAWDSGMGHPQTHTHANTQQGEEQEQLQYHVHQLAHPHATNYQQQQQHQLTGPGQLHQSTLHGWELQQDSPYPSEDVYADVDVNPHLQHQHQREVAPYAAGSANDHSHNHPNQHEPHVYGNEAYGNGQPALAPGEDVGNGNDNVDGDEEGQDDSQWLPMPPMPTSPHTARPAPPQLVTLGGLAPSHDARSSSSSSRTAVDRQLARVLVPASGMVAVGGEGGSAAVGSAAAVLPAAAGRAPSPQPVSAARDGMATAAVAGGGRRAGPVGALPQPVALTGSVSMPQPAAGTVALHGSQVALVGKGTGGGRRRQVGSPSAESSDTRLQQQQQQQQGEESERLGSSVTGTGTRRGRGRPVGSGAAGAVAAAATTSRRSKSGSALVAAAPEAAGEQLACVTAARRRRVACSSTKSGGAVAVAAAAAAPAVLSHSTSTSGPSSNNKDLLQGNIVPSQSLSAGAPVGEPAVSAKRPRKAVRKDPVAPAPAATHIATQQDAAAAGVLGAGPAESEAAALQAVVHYAVCAWQSTLDEDAFAHLRTVRCRGQTCMLNGTHCPVSAPWAELTVAGIRYALCTKRPSATGGSGQRRLGGAFGIAILCLHNSPGVSSGSLPAPGFFAVVTSSPRILCRSKLLCWSLRSHLRSLPARRSTTGRRDGGGGWRRRAHRLGRTALRWRLHVPCSKG